MVLPMEAQQRLASAPWVSRPEAQAIMDLLDGSAGRVRVVGGAVRDVLLGRFTPTTDIDMATELVPDEVSRRALAAGMAVYPTGIEHGTVTLKLGDFTTEVTTLREDVATDGRHAVVRFGHDWQADAARRDFTMNALYSGMDGTLFDPLNGVGDCLAGHVRFIGDADRRIAEDRLRVFRFFRFSASHGGQDFDAEGLAASARAAGDLGQLSPERVGAEMVRMLALPAVAKTLAAMGDAGILTLAEKTRTALEHYEALDSASWLGRATLLAADGGVDGLRERWRLSNRQVEAIEAVRAVIDLLGKGEIARAFYEHAGVFADAVGLAPVLLDWSDARAAEVLGEFSGAPPKFPVRGADLAASGIAPGKGMGAQLKLLQDRWIESGFTLTRDELLAMVGK